MPKYTSEKHLHRLSEQNARYLMHLRDTGNATLAATMTGMHVDTFRARRRADPDFEQACRTAIVFARGALWDKGGAAPAEPWHAARRKASAASRTAQVGEAEEAPAPATAPPDATARAIAAGMVAAGGEYMIGANPNNGLQVRRARRGHVTARGEAAFLEALSHIANIRLAAEAVGVDARAFYKRRAKSPDFARRMQDALAAGYEAVEFALLNTALRTLAPETIRGADADAGAQGAGPGADGPRMSVDQAMTLVAQRSKTMAIGERHTRGHFTPMPTPEESDAALLQRLDMLARKKARAAERLKEG